jgi:tetratricopeptide (TPR) repeat protein
MINNKDTEEIEIEALHLIDQAETLAQDGKGKEAINLYEKAAQKYLDLGSYMKLDELFVKIASIISKFKNNIQAVYRLKSIIRKTEELKLHEISARLLIQLGNLAYKMKDFETAAESWKKASDLLYEIDPEEFYNVSSELLLKAGQAFEKTNYGKDKGERLILKAVMTVNKFDELYRKEDQRALQLLTMEEYKASANKYLEISKYFNKAIKNIDTLIEESEEKKVLNNAKARLMHLEAEYKALAALCLRASENREYNEKIKQLGNEVISELKVAITILKDVITKEKIDTDREDILRLTFDGLLISIMQGMLGNSEIDPIDYLLKDIDNKTFLKKIKDSPYFELTERIEKVGIRDSLDKLNKITLGHIDKVKTVLIPYFY